MTREEAKIIFLNRGYIESDGGSYFDGNKWRESITVISEWLKAEIKDDNSQKPETVTEFADRCRECGAKYGKLLKQKTAHWIDDDNGFGTKCSKCGKWYSHSYLTKREVIYCNRCGRKMTEKEDKNGGTT